ncbi:MAG TPA: aspartate carbamoyltransferase catalytic subunit [Armatimonadota bacterium]|nr:aspartate carbamoyltransferase catalytic subunit [Armatimonadota bacterium]
MRLKRKDILGLEEITAEEIELILQTAISFKEILGRQIKKVPTLRGRSIVTLFYEPSTRTRTSFEVAAKIMSADVSSIAPSTSSVVKGESLKDTILTLRSMKPDVFIMRHSASGAPHFVAGLIPESVINAGDGMHEHPTQGLLDMMTIYEKKERFSGLTVAIVGDILHSRVARSNMWGLTKLGAKVRLVGPKTLIPPEANRLPVEVYTNVEEGIKGADVVNVLRIQLERMKTGLFPSIREYSKLYGITRDRLKLAKEDVIVMHPGPMNRGVEIMPDVADSDISMVTTQVTNGVAVRMALLYLLMGGAEDAVAA